MKFSGVLRLFLTLGILAHCGLTVGLIAIGYFDFMGFAEAAETEAKLFQLLALHGDAVYRQMSIEALNVASSTLAAFKMLAAASFVSLLAHILSALVLRKRKAPGSQ